MGMKKLAALVMALVLCLTATGAMAAEAKIGNVEYDTVNNAFADAEVGDTITLLNNVTYTVPDSGSVRYPTKASIIDLNDYKLTIDDASSTKFGDLRFGTTEFKNGTIEIASGFKPSTALFYMFSNEVLTFNNVTINASNMTGTYLFDLEGNAECHIKDSEIILNNCEATAFAHNGSTGGYTIDNSKISADNCGTVLYGGNYNIKNNSMIDVKNSTEGTKSASVVLDNSTINVEDTNAAVVLLNDTFVLQNKAKLIAKNCNDDVKLYGGNYTGEISADATCTFSARVGEGVVNNVDPAAYPPVPAAVNGAVEELPKTGDNSHLLFFAALLAISAAGLMVVRGKSEN